MRAFRYVVADVFTDTPLAGNPVAVFTDARGLEDEEMQRLARELNLSETVFVFPAEAGGHARIRIFTPGLELPFAGHPTLGTAFVLGGPLQLDEIRLETLKGIVPVRLEREENRIVFGRMVQPVPTWKTFADEGPLLAALGVERSELPVEEYDNGAQHVYVALGSEDEVARLRPNLSEADLPEALGTNCFAGSGSRWKTRMFGLGGIPEDPATGSAAGPLCAYLNARTGAARVDIVQGEAMGRPSRLMCEAGERVRVAGDVVLLAEGEIEL
jgi:trans-2,3-dihydro-3-hydroxyanthranilate isomerase